MLLMLYYILKIPLPARERRIPTLFRMKSILHSVANRTTPKRLMLSDGYVIKIGENMRKNLAAMRLVMPI